MLHGFYCSSRKRKIACNIDEKERYVDSAYLCVLQAIFTSVLDTRFDKIYNKYKEMIAKYVDILI